MRHGPHGREHARQGDWLRLTTTLRPFRSLLICSCPRGCGVTTHWTGSTTASMARPPPPYQRSARATTGKDHTFFFVSLNGANITDASFTCADFSCVDLRGDIGTPAGQIAER